MTTDPQYGAPSLPPLPPPMPPRPVPAMAKNPVVASFLSLFPGLGQVYNGQPAKALVFFFGFALSIWATAEGDPMPFALLIPFVYLYNVVDAWRSASLINARAAGGALLEEDAAESPAWGGTLVTLGALLLANNLGWLRLASLQRYWPVLLIVAGIVMLWTSLERRKEQ